MPIYTYKCLLCNETIDVFVRKTHSPPPVCKDCMQGEMEQVPAIPSPFVWGPGSKWN